MGRILKNIPYGEGERQLLDIYIPAGEGPFPTVVFFHGGGLVSGSKEELAGLAAELNGAGYALIAPNYRLYPHANIPDFIEDAAAAVHWAATEGTRYLPVSGLCIGGYSAGCYLAMILFFDKQWLGVYGMDPDALAGCLFLSGQPTKHYEVLSRMGADPRRIIVDNTAPLYYVRSTGPALLFVVSSTDMPNRLAQNRLLESTLRHYEYQSPIVFTVLEGPGHGDFLKDRGDGKSWFGGEAVAFLHQYVQ